MSTVVVEKPGVHDVPEAVYHADTTTLSYSGMKMLLQSPAKFHWQRTNPPAPKDVFDLGAVVHTLVLGAGPKLVTVEADNWYSKAAKEARTAARTEGAIALLAADMDKAQAMADAVLSHPTAGAILSNGTPEQSLYWTDSESGVNCRARVDWLRTNALVDVKTCADASPGGFSRAAWTFHYEMQAAHYRAGAAAVGLGDLPFLNVCVEKEEPYLIAVYQLDDEALSIGRSRCDRALRLYADCEAAGTWPGYSPDVELLTLPRYATY